MRSPARPRATPSPSAAEGGDEALAWQRTPGPGLAGEIRGRVYDAEKFGPEARLSRPELGPSVASRGLVAASDRPGNTIFAFVQGAVGARKLVVAVNDRPPSAPRVRSFGGSGGQDWLRTRARRCRGRRPATSGVRSTYSSTRARSPSTRPRRRPSGRPPTCPTASTRCASRRSTGASSARSGRCADPGRHDQADGDDQGDQGGQRPPDAAEAQDLRRRAAARARGGSGGGLGRGPGQGRLRRPLAAHRRARHRDPGPAQGLPHLPPHGGRSRSPCGSTTGRATRPRSRRP